MSDDIVTRLRKKLIIEPLGDKATYLTLGDCLDAADEIERLRAVADDLANHLRGYICHCQMSKCKCGYDAVMDAYEAVRGVPTN